MSETMIEEKPKKPRKQCREWKDWQPKLYKPSYCIDLVLVMANGRGTETFNSDKNISRQLFYNWLKQYPDFRLAYALGKEKAKKYMIEYPGSKDEPGGPRINMKAWQAVMKYSHELPDSRLVELPEFDPAGSIKNQMTTILQALSEGIITPDEALKLGQLLDVAQKITETAELTERLSEIEKAMQSGSMNDEFKEE